MGNDFCAGCCLESCGKKFQMASSNHFLFSCHHLNILRLQEHPECAFNCQNSPHLRPAYILDRALYHFSTAISEGKYADRGLPDVIDSDDHLGALAHILRTDLLPSLKLHEFFQIGIDNCIEALRQNLGAGSFHTMDDGATKLRVAQDREFRRFGSCVDLDSATRMFLSRMYVTGFKFRESKSAFSEVIIAVISLKRNEFMEKFGKNF